MRNSKRSTLLNHRWDVRPFKITWIFEDVTICKTNVSLDSPRKNKILIRYITDLNRLYAYNECETTCKVCESSCETKTLCDWEFLAPHKLSHTLQKLSHSLHAFLLSHQVSSKYWTCTKSYATERGPNYCNARHEHYR